MFYPFLLAHLIADFICQPYWLIKRKSSWSGLFIHCGIVLLWMLALIPLEPTLAALWPSMLLITLVHLAADRWKVRYGHVIPGPPIVPFLVDQLIHMTTIIVTLSLVLPQSQIWIVHASSLYAFVIIASIYVVATFAVPIAVMTWLDPHFQSIQLSGQARMHSFLLAALTLTMVYQWGLLGLIVVGLVLAIVLRKPLSIHPLDRGNGVLSVVSIAAILGYGLNTFPF